MPPLGFVKGNMLTNSQKAIIVDKLQLLDREASPWSDDDNNKEIM